MATNDQILPTTGPEKARDNSIYDSDSQPTLHGQPSNQYLSSQPTLHGQPSNQHLGSQRTLHGASSNQNIEIMPQNPWWPEATYGPLSRWETTGERLPAFGGSFQPGLYKPPTDNQANPAPLGLAGFALTTFLLSLVNLGTRDLTAPNMVVGPAFAYGGLCQLLAGMWELGYGNTFGGWALGSYGGFWISLGIIFTPGGFGIAEAYGGENAAFYNALGLYLIVSFSASLPGTLLPLLLESL